MDKNNNDIRRQILIALSIKYKGDWNEIYYALARKEEVNISSHLEEINGHDFKIVTILDDNYPIILRQCIGDPSTAVTAPLSSFSLLIFLLLCLKFGSFLLCFVIIHKKN